MPNIDEQVAQFIVTDSEKFAAMPIHFANKLYFLTDTQEIYRGNVLFTGSVVFYDAVLPDEGAMKKLYINRTTYDGYTWTGTDWVQIIHQYQIVSEIDKDTPNGYIPNVGAIKRVQTTIITDLKYNDQAKGLVFIRNSKEEPVKISGLISSGDYDYASSKIILKNLDGEEVLSFRIPRDNYVIGGHYDPSTKNIIFNMRSAENDEAYDLIIPAADLVRIDISKVEGNLLTEYDDGYGVVIDLSTKIDKVASGKDGRVLTATSDGNANAVNMFIGGSHLSLIDIGDGRYVADPGLLATEAAVYNYIKDINDAISNITKYEITSEINMDDPSPLKYPSEIAIVGFFNGVNTRVKNLNTNVNNLISDINDTQLNVSNLTNNVANLSSEVLAMQDLATQLRPLIGALDSINQAISNHQDALEANATVVSGIQNEVSAIKDNVIALAIQLATLSDDNNNRLQTLAGDIETIQDNLGDLTASYNTFRDNINDSLNGISQQLSALETTSREMDEATTVEYYT